ncbi:MAG: DUF934 domain-containing protein [Pseudomonadota bacterium]
MPLIKDGAEIEDVWAFVPDDAPIEPGGCFTVTLERFLGEGAELLLRNQSIGVRLTPDNDPHPLAAYFERLALIEVDFPKYTDGRGYSQAQLLRRRLGYEGELRAVGHVLRDQLLYMHRSGFDAYSTTRADLPSFLEAMGEFSSFYQPAATGAAGVFAARHGR